jgi:peptidoglycan/xylan/chitin deacetylase (PgdA/CDA1 family)
MAPGLTSNPRIPFQMSTERPPLVPPQGKPLIVHLLVAIENWRFDDHMPRQIIPGPHGARSVPDVVNWSWAEYGMRCGMPRLLRALGERKLKADACISASVIDVYPSVAEAIREQGWEFQGHGLHQRAASEDGERAMIKQALDRLEAFCGYRPRGWTGPGMKETDDTLDHLRAEGVIYTCDWIVDDLPCWIRTKHGPMVAVPYTLELNDSVLYAVEKHSSSEQFDRLKYTLEGLEKELEHAPRVLSLSLHHHLNGVPHRVRFLEKMLDLLLDRKDTIFMTGGEIADWFIEADKANDGKPNQGKLVD